MLNVRTVRAFKREEFKKKKQSHVSRGRGDSESRAKNYASYISHDATDQYLWGMCVPELNSELLLIQKHRILSDNVTGLILTILFFYMKKSWLTFFFYNTANKPQTTLQEKKN